jgi:hypothetical protein
MGREWLSVTDPGGRRRIDCEDDFVRLEVAAALSRDVRVIPVLVQNTAMPGATELPAALAKLSRHQACEISDSRWQYDVEQLIRVIGGGQGLVKPFFWQRRPRDVTSARRILWTSVIVLGISTAVVIGRIIWQGPRQLERAEGRETVQTNTVNQLTPLEASTGRNSITEVRLTGETHQAIKLEVHYKYSGDAGVENIVLRAEATDEAGERALGSRGGIRVGIGEGVVDLVIVPPDTWLPAETSRLLVGFYRVDESGSTYDFIVGRKFALKKSWKASP